MLVTDQAHRRDHPQERSRWTRTRATAPTPRSRASPALKPVFKDGQRVKEGKFITAGNASQLSDGASAARADGGKRGRAPRPAAARHLSRHGGRRLRARTRWASARSSPCRSCSTQHGLKIDDIDLWELNEAFACQVLYCRDRLGIPHDKLNVNGGAISIGHPYGMSGARMVGHALIEGKRRGAKLRRRARCASAAAWARPGCSRSPEMPVDPQIQMLLDLRAALPPLHTLSVADARAQFAARDFPGLRKPDGRERGQPRHARTRRLAAVADLHAAWRGAVSADGVLPRQRLRGVQPGYP